MEAVNKIGKGGGAQRTRMRRDPDRTRERILEAALNEFSDKGLEGARVDEIARRAKSNKRMLYHYFGNKDELFRAVLERAYADIRQSERELNLGDLNPAEGMRRLVDFTFVYPAANSRLIRLLYNENLHRGEHLKGSTDILEMHTPLVAEIGQLLRRGHRAGVFRGDIDPVQLYISIAALGYFYFSNIHTLSAIFDRDLKADAAVAKRRSHVADVILSYLRP